MRVRMSKKTWATLGAIVLLLGLAACGVRPDELEAPPEADPAAFPKSYPRIP